jgi:hypothetical protein
LATEEPLECRGAECRVAGCRVQGAGMETANVEVIPGGCIDDDINE